MMLYITKYIPDYIRLTGVVEEKQPITEWDDTLFKAEKRTDIIISLPKSKKKRNMTGLKQVSLYNPETDDLVGTYSLDTIMDKFNVKESTAKLYAYKGMIRKGYKWRMK